MSVVPYNNSGGTYSTFSATGGLPRSTVLLSRPVKHCRCDICTYDVRQQIELSIYEPVEPLMIPTLSNQYAWWNVRLPSKLLEPVVTSTDAEFISIDEDVMSFFEEKKVINWCPGLRQLNPIRTTGDGNCLMHAVILATCGIQDSGLVLRRLVYVALVEASSNSFRKRWQKEKQRLNESIPGGLQYTLEEWDKEWTMVVNAAEDLRKTTMAYEFLEEMHVFVLANVICRPIIILGESTVRSPLAGDSIEQNNFVGIYLPLLRRPEICEPNPVVLCFLHNHFQPLISRYKLPSEPKDMLAIPLVTSRLEPLHIHFLLPDEESKAHDLLQKYLYTFEVPRKSEDGCSDEAILVAEIYYSQTYYDWELSDYLYLTNSAQKDSQKIAQAPSKSTLNYIQPAKAGCRVHRTLDDVTQPECLAVKCSHCGGTSQKSLVSQAGGSVDLLESPLGKKDCSKIQFDESKGCSNQVKICPCCSKSLSDHAKIHHDHSATYVDRSDQNKHLQLKQSKILTGAGQDRRHGAPEAESIPDNIMIFNTLKKLKSPQEEDAARRGSNRLDGFISSDKGRQQGAVDRECSWDKSGYGYKSKMATQLPSSGFKKSTVGPKTPVSQSTKLRSSTAGNQGQPRRKLSDVSDADVEYIQQKFTFKTPIYCRSLALLGKQCAKPDCNRFVERETDFCCSIHVRPNPPPKVAVKSAAQCTRAGCLNPGMARYSDMCANCFVYCICGSGYGRSVSNVAAKSQPTDQEPQAASVSVMEPTSKCIYGGCKNRGFTTFVGMCATCFVLEYTTAFPTSKSLVSTEKREAEGTVEALNEIECTTDGCKGLGYAAYCGLCFKCYVLLSFAANPAEEGTEPKEKAETKGTVDPLTHVPCITEGCKGFGRSAWFDLCPLCYLEAWLAERPDRHDTPYTSVVSSETKLQQRSTENLDDKVWHLYRIPSYTSGGDRKENYLLIPPLSNERDKHLEELPQDNLQLPAIVATEVEPGQIQTICDRLDSKSIEENFDDWLDKAYTPKKVLDRGALSPESPISEKLPYGNEGVEQDKGDLEMKVANDCEKNKESFQGRDRRLAIGKDDGLSSSSKNMLERSTGKRNLEDLTSVTAFEMSLPDAGSENYGELSSDDVGPVDGVLPGSPESGNGLCFSYTIHSNASDLVASGDQGSDEDKFKKCPIPSDKHVGMDSVAKEYCVASHKARSQEHMDAHFRGVAVGLSNQPIQETIVRCVMEGCSNFVAITELGLCSTCYAYQLKASNSRTDHALRFPQQKSVSSALLCVTKANETLKPSTSSGLPPRAMPCLRSSCDRYGDPVYQGYCSQCATQFKNSALEIDSC